MIMVTLHRRALGGFVGGQIVGRLLRAFGWPVIFILGGVFPLILVVGAGAWLPKSPRFLAARAKPVAAPARRCCGASTSPRTRAAASIDVARRNPIKMLFGPGYALQTVLLSIIYFCSLMNLFLFAYWMPTVLNLIGMTPVQAVFASSLRDFGAIFAVLYLGAG